MAAFAIYFVVFSFLAAEFGDRASYASTLPATMAAMALGAPRQLGAFDYLTKPWSLSELLERVRWALVSVRKTAAYTWARLPPCLSNYPKTPLPAGEGQGEGEV